MRRTIVFAIAVLLFGGGVAQASVDPAGPLQAALAKSAGLPGNVSDPFVPVSGVAHGITRVAVAALPEPIGSSAVAVLSPRSISPRVAPQPPALLVPLYTTLAALQALDVDSTLRAIHTGAGREANPMLQAIVGSPAALLAVKAGTTAAVILASERLRKDHHPLAALVLMIGVNSAYAMVAAHNYSVSRGW